MQGQITHKTTFRVPHSIMEKAERSARVSGKPVEEFIKLYVTSVMDSDIEHETKTPNPKKSA